MQFKVPQNVQREDKIVGPLTLKQMIICAAGGTVAYGIYISLARFYIWITWLPPVAIISMITLAFAFLRPLDLSFTKWIIRWIEFSLIPRSRKWIKSSAEVLVLPNVTAKRKTDKDEKDKAELDVIEEKQRKLRELNKFLEEETKK